MAAQTLPRNANRVRLILDPVDSATVQRVLENGIRRAIGDPAAIVGFYSAVGGEDLVITVKQAHGTWWAMMPSGFAEVIDGYDGTCTMRWHDSEPPKAVDD